MLFLGTVFIFPAEAEEMPASKTVIPLQMRAGTAAALGSVAAHAKLLADQEEREVEHLMATVIGTQVDNRFHYLILVKGF